MLLALILTLNFSSPLSEENAVGVRFQSHTEYKIIEILKIRDLMNTLMIFAKYIIVQ